jgi:plasmid stability protein
MKNIIIRGLADQIHKQLKHSAVDHDLSMNQMSRKIINDFIKQYNNKRGGKPEVETKGAGASAFRQASGLPSTKSKRR